MEDAASPSPCHSTYLARHLHNIHAPCSYRIARLQSRGAEVALHSMPKRCVCQLRLGRVHPPPHPIRLPAKSAAVGISPSRAARPVMLGAQADHVWGWGWGIPIPIPGVTYTHTRARARTHTHNSGGVPE